MPLRPLATTTGRALPLQPLRSLLRAERRAIHFGLQPPFLSRAERGDVLRQGGPGFERPVQTPRQLFWSETLNNVEPAACSSSSRPEVAAELAQVLRLAVLERAVSRYKQCAADRNSADVIADRRRQRGELESEFSQARFRVHFYRPRLFAAIRRRRQVADRSIAAIDHQLLPKHEVGGRAREKHDGVGDLRLGCRTARAEACACNLC